MSQRWEMMTMDCLAHTLFDHNSHWKLAYIINLLSLSTIAFILPCFLSHHCLPDWFIRQPCRSSVQVTTEHQAADCTLAEHLLSQLCDNSSMPSINDLTESVPTFWQFFAWCRGINAYYIYMLYILYIKLYIRCNHPVGDPMGPSINWNQPFHGSISATG